jgi:hypothetical protein
MSQESFLLGDTLAGFLKHGHASLPLADFIKSYQLADDSLLAVMSTRKEQKVTFLIFRCMYPPVGLETHCIL